MKIKKKSIKSINKRLIVNNKIKTLKSNKHHLLINKSKNKKSFNKKTVYLKNIITLKIKKII